MAVALRSSSVVSPGSAGFGAYSFTAPVPSGATTGDLLVAVLMVAKEGTTAPTTVPAGWTMRGSLAPASGARSGANGAACVYTKSATSSEGSGYDWTSAATTCMAIGCFTGANLSAPLTAGPVWATSSTDTMTTGSVTPGSGDALFAAFSQLNGSGAVTTSTPSGMTVINAATRSGNYLSAGFFVQTGVAASSTTRAATSSPAASGTAVPTQQMLLAVAAAAVATDNSAFMPFF